MIAPKGLPSSHLASISDVIITQNSTIGIQALFMKKPVVYFDRHSNYKDIAIQTGAAYQADNPTDLNKQIDRLYSRKSLIDLSQLEIPNNFSEKMNVNIDNLLKKPSDCSYVKYYFNYKKQ